MCVAETDLAVGARARGVRAVLFAGAVAAPRAPAALGRALGPGVPGAPDGTGPGGKDGHRGWGWWDAHGVRTTAELGENNGHDGARRGAEVGEAETTAEVAGQTLVIETFKESGTTAETGTDSGTLTVLLYLFLDVARSYAIFTEQCLQVNVQLGAEYFKHFFQSVRLLTVHFTLF